MNSIAAPYPRGIHIDSIYGARLTPPQLQRVTLTRPSGRNMAMRGNSNGRIVDVIPPERLAVARSTQIAYRAAYRARPTVIQKRQPVLADSFRRAANGVLSPLALAFSAIASMVKRRRAKHGPQVSKAAAAISAALAEKRKKIAALFAGLSKRIGLAKLRWVPKKYTAAYGLQADYTGKVFTGAKLAVPITIVLLFLSITTAPWPLMQASTTSKTPPKAAAATGRHEQRSTASTTASTKPVASWQSSTWKSGAWSASMSNKTSPAALPMPMTAATAPAATNLPGLSGGMGGGNPVTTPTSLPTPTTPAPIVDPPTVPVPLPVPAPVALPDPLPTVVTQTVDTTVTGITNVLPAVLPTL